MITLWYLFTIVSSALLRYTDSDYPFGIFWPLCRQFFFDIQILITPLVSCGHCVVSSSSIYRFWLSLWYLVAIVSSVLLRYTDSDYPLVSCGHCVVCSSSIYRFWLSLWYLVAIVSSVLLRYTDSDYPFNILWPLCRLPLFDIGIRITPLVSCAHCVVSSSSIYRFWLPLWYLLAIVLSVLIRYRDSDYSFGICWPLCCQFFFDIRIQITPLVSFGHCVVSSSSIYRFWLPLWYILTIVLSVLLRYTDSDYPFGIFWPLCCQFFFDIRILITSLVSFGHCIVSSSSIYRFWLPLWYLFAIVLSVLLRYRDSDLPLWYLLAIVLSDLLRYRDSDLTLWYLLAIVLSVLLRYTDSDDPIGIFWALCPLLFFDIWILINSLVCFGYFAVSFSLIYRFWLPLWYLLIIVSSAFLDIQIMITPLVSCGHCFVCSSSIYRFWLPLWYLVAIVSSAFLDIQIMITPLVSCGHCVVSSSSIYRFWLPFGILWPLCRLLFFDIQILITHLVSCGHCVVFSSSIYRFWLPLWYLVAIVSSAFLDIQIMITPLVSCGHCVVSSSSIYRFWLPFGILWPLCRLLFFDIQILITHLVSCGHCVVFSSSIYRFWLPLWYLVAIVSSALLRYTDSDYPFGIFWPLCCQFLFDIGIRITPLVSFGHCVVSSSSIYRFWLPLWYLLDHRVVSSSSIYWFWLPLWYLLAIVLSVLLRYTDSDYTFGIFWPLCCQFFFDIRIQITPLVSFGHYVVCPSLIYGFWIPLWYVLAIVSSVLLWYTDSDYPFGIFWPLCRLLFFDIQILITPLVSFDHCVVSSSLIYGFWLPLWYLLAIMLSVLLRNTDSDYPFGIFWPLCCQFFFDMQILITPLVSCGHCVVSSSLI